jgi:pyruvate,water dikinase
MRIGFQEVTKRYGLPIDYLDIRFVNDHWYARLVAVGAPEPKPGKPSSPPPRFVMWSLARLHPELRRRARTARAVLAAQRWHDDLQRWESGLRDEVLQTDRDLQGEDVTAKSDDDLVDHLGRVADQMVRGIIVHFDLMLVHNLPLGRLVAGCRSWGISDADALGLLAGSSPASAGSTAALRRIHDACRAAGVEPQTLDDVRGASPDAGAALDEYLSDHAWRVVADYTPRALALIELPDVLVRAIRGAAASGPVLEPDAARFRARVPEAERERFDDLLADARRCYGIRDDNVGITVTWPVGLVRRAILEVGRRLVERGVIDEASEAMALSRNPLNSTARFIKKFNIALDGSRAFLLPNGIV